MRTELDLPHVLPPGFEGASCATLDTHPTAYVSGALWSRHAAGRACAARALAQLHLGLGGHDTSWRAPPLPRLPSGAPDWPAGVVGSITHTPHASHAAVAWRKHWRAVGIDSEARLDLDNARALLPVCADGAEQALVRAMAEVAWATTALFSAKEAFYKAAGSQDARALEFDAVRVLGFAPGPQGAQVLRLQPAAFLQMGPCVATVLSAGAWVHSSVCLPA